MAHDCAITAQLLRRQQAMFLEASNRGITQKEIQCRTGLGRTNIGQYARGETAMGGAAMLKIRKVVGAELFSMLFDDGDLLIEVPGEIDHSIIAEKCHEYLAQKTAAHHPDSEAGEAIGPNERASLDGKVMAIGGGR